jgi:hypothetical protein
MTTGGELHAVGVGEAEAIGISAERALDELAAPEGRALLAVADPLEAARSARRSDRTNADIARKRTLRDESLLRERLMNDSPAVEVGYKV